MKCEADEGRKKGRRSKSHGCLNNQHNVGLMMLRGKQADPTWSGDAKRCQSLVRSKVKLDVVGPEAGDFRLVLVVDVRKDRV
jgi:hypothetical protein